jgi:hypothetical protein
MTQRTMPAGASPTVIIKTGASVTVRGQDTETITAETSDSWGLQVEKHSAAEIARARAAVGEHVLFDVRVRRPRRRDEDPTQEVIEVQIGGNGQVMVPRGASLKVYGGGNIDIENIQGAVDAYSGGNLRLHAINSIGIASAGGSMNLECRTLLRSTVEFNAGGDLRFHVDDLRSARVRVRDLGGYWEALIGNGEKLITLKSGGDVTLVTDERVEAQPPNYLLGQVEKPSPA